MSWGGALVAVVLGAGPSAPPPVEVGARAPAFRLPSYEVADAGCAPVGLERYLGPDAREPATRALIVSFMASSCAPCVQELPALQALAERRFGQGLRVLGVSVDAEAEEQRAMQALIVRHGVSFPVLKDRFGLVARRWLGDEPLVPTLFLVSRTGAIAAVHRGFNEDDFQQLLGEVERLLKAP